MSTASNTRNQNLFHLLEGEGEDEVQTTGDEFEPFEHAPPPPIALPRQDQPFPAPLAEVLWPKQDQHLNHHLQWGLDPTNELSVGYRSCMRPLQGKLDHPGMHENDQHERGNPY